jgi:hypothetical protein
MTRNIQIDLQLSLADIEAELPDMSGELPAYRIGQRALKGAIDDALNLKTACLAVRALSRPWPRGRFPDAIVHLADDDRRAGVCAPLTPGGEEAGSRVNGFR